MYDVHDGPVSLEIQKDNLWPHKAKIIADFLANEEFIRINWLPQSPYLNSIQKVWTLMKIYPRKCTALPKNSIEIFRILWSI